MKFEGIQELSLFFEIPWKIIEKIFIVPAASKNKWKIKWEILN